MGFAPPKAHVVDLWGALRVPSVQLLLRIVCFTGAVDTQSQASRLEKNQWVPWLSPNLSIEKRAVTFLGKTP